MSSFKQFLVKNYDASSRDKVLKILGDVEFASAISVSENFPTPTIFKRSMTIESSCCSITSVHSKNLKCFHGLLADINSVNYCKMVQKPFFSDLGEKENHLIQQTKYSH